MAARRRGLKDDDEVNWIQCGGCKIWLDYSVTGLPLPFIEKDVKKMKYTCKICILTAKVQELTTECTSLKERVKKLEEEKVNGNQLLTDLVRVPEDIIELKSSMTTLGQTCATIPQTPNLSSIQLKQAADEAQEIEKRKLSLIVVGLPEGTSGSNLTSLIEYAKNDCKVDFPLDATDFTACERLGRDLTNQNGRPRLLRIKFKTYSKRRAILLMRQHMDAGGENRRIFIRPDLTKAQQDIDKKLRDDLAVAGKDNYMIRRGRIVPRHPIPTFGQILPLELTSSPPDTAPSTANEHLSTSTSTTTTQPPPPPPPTSSTSTQSMPSPGSPGNSTGSI